MHVMPTLIFGLHERGWLNRLPSPQPVKQSESGAVVADRLRRSSASVGCWWAESPSRLLAVHLSLSMPCYDAPPGRHHHTLTSHT